jgi:hypothetical protein
MVRFSSVGIEKEFAQAAGHAGKLSQAPYMVQVSHKEEKLQKEETMKCKCGAVTAAILVFLIALQAAAAAMPETQGKLNIHGSQEGLKIQADDIGITSASG